VAQRALIQCAVVCRGNIDQFPDEPVVVETNDRIRNWLERLGLIPIMEPLEATTLNAPLGTLDRPATIAATWSAEGLAMLAWALNRFNLPWLDEKVDPFELTDSLSFLHDEAGSLLEGGELRPFDELQACRELLYAVHCRVRQAQRRRERTDFTSWIDPTWLELLCIDRDELIIDRELAVDRKAVVEIDDDRTNVVEWTVRQRHRACIWLVGEYEVYTETPADT
jgi:hypothetical protein